MSKHNNANWDHYKEAGRERQGDDIVHHDEKQVFQGARAHAEGRGRDEPHIPNQERASAPAGGLTAADASEAALAGREEVSVAEDEGAVGRAQDDEVDEDGKGAPALSDDEGMVD